MYNGCHGDKIEFALSYDYCVNYRDNFQARGFTLDGVTFQKGGDLGETFSKWHHACMQNVHHFRVCGMRVFFALICEKRG